MTEQMSSVAKGDRFEARVYECFRQIIDAGDFWAASDCCRIYRKKRYYSRDRDADIVFDITIEIRLPGADAYSVLVVIECKDYAVAVPVGDVEHLFSRMQQVSGGNTKGIVVATGEFQSSAMSYAASKGIGIARCLEDDKLKWLLRRTPASWGFGRAGLLETREILHVLGSRDYVSATYEFYCAIGNRGTNSIAELFLDIVRAQMGAEASRLLLREIHNSELVPYRSAETIEATASHTLVKVGYRAGRVPFEDICEQQRQESGLRYEYRVPTPEESRRRELGNIDFRNNLITVYNLGTSEADRQRFTLAHEIGHYLLGHGDILLSERCQEYDIEESEAVTRIPNHHLRRMEIQANQFASFLLLPTRQLLGDMQQLSAEFGLRDKGYGLIYLDHQACNRRDYMIVTDRLRIRYGATRTAITYRLKALGLLVDAHSAPHTGGRWWDFFG